MRKCVAYVGIVVSLAFSVFFGAMVLHVYNQRGMMERPLPPRDVTDYSAELALQLNRLDYQLFEHGYQVFALPMQSPAHPVDRYDSARAYHVGPSPDGSFGINFERRNIDGIVMPLASRRFPQIAPDVVWLGNLDANQTTVEMLAGVHYWHPAGEPYWQPLHQLRQMCLFTSGADYTAWNVECLPWPQGMRGDLIEVEELDEEGSAVLITVSDSSTQWCDDLLGEYPWMMLSAQSEKISVGTRIDGWMARRGLLRLDSQMRSFWEDRL
jgi:hypothetical protein